MAGGERVVLWDGDEQWDAGVEPAWTRAGDEVLEDHIADQRAQEQTGQQKDALPAVFFGAEQAAPRCEPDGPAVAQQGEPGQEKIEEGAGGQVPEGMEDGPIEIHASRSPFGSCCSAAFFRPSRPSRTRMPSKKAGSWKVERLSGGSGVSRLAGPFAMA